MALSKPPRGLMLRKLADKSSGSRVPMLDSNGVQILVNPDSPGEYHEPWPLAGVKILDNPLPDPCRISTNLVEQGIHEGWITVEGDKMVHRPGGPPGNLWRVTHSLMQVSSITIHTIDGDVHYQVTRQPDKYVEDGKDTDKVTDEIYASGNTVVDKFYDMKLVSHG